MAMSWTQRTICDWLKTELPIRDSLEQSWCDGIKARPVEGWSAGKATSGVLAINHFTCWGQFGPKLGGGRTNQDYLPSIGRVLGMVGVNVIQRERRWVGLRYRTEGGVSLRLLSGGAWKYARGQKSKPPILTHTAHSTTAFRTSCQCH